ncbi:MAG: hypothetical protein PHP23_10540 [Desulfobacterales bacterium]|nr:hypothetical protein [Desulfobacterales bacterium]MDD4072748.1 hypothetical protein [Desulfobacterales bacterium]MDD4392464.1 hypothetical protein [Desulfobacterales bacterium]
MTRLPEIWSCIIRNAPKSYWITLEEIYKLVESNANLDVEDFEPQAPLSIIPKWKRNVRNVLQYRKKTGEIKWDGNAKYLL